MGVVGLMVAGACADADNIGHADATDDTAQLGIALGLGFVSGAALGAACAVLRTAARTRWRAAFAAAAIVCALVTLSIRLAMCSRVCQWVKWEQAVLHMVVAALCVAVIGAFTELVAEGAEPQQQQQQQQELVVAPTDV
jgi:peptidoglycan/LPS O-acetylase OafA/YrhL